TLVDGLADVAMNELNNSVDVNAIIIEGCYKFCFFDNTSLNPNISKIITTRSNDKCVNNIIEEIRISPGEILIWVYLSVTYKAVACV
ncbi:MAG: hypothetical protein H0U27_03250, partial [Nitrosopumilus sp.]|nr:hypothetical protein [Nitrosopumilus sp.]